MRCLRVESVHSDSDLHDLEIEGGGHNYIAETIVVHNTNCQIGYVPGLDHDELFFGGCIYVASKGLGGQGLVLKNNEKNADNTYVKVLKELLENGFGEKIALMSTKVGGLPVRVFGEIYGAGVQKGFNYGKSVHSFAAFDIQVGWEYLPHDDMIHAAKLLGLPVVPLLHEGPYDLETLKPFRDGKDSMSGTTLREGIVIKARDGSRHPHHGRKIGKWVSPDYLLKATGDEFN
jgi:RNA ligase (TIGR02306 family)